MNDKNDDNDAHINLDHPVPVPVPESEAWNRDASHHRAAAAHRQRMIHIPQRQHTAGNVIYIREWLLRMAEERHADARDPVAKAIIERMLMRLSTHWPGDESPAETFPSRR